MSAPAQLHFPGFPPPPPPLESEVLIRLLPIEVTPKGAHLKVLMGWTGIYPTVADACSAAEAMGLTNV